MTSGTGLMEKPTLPSKPGNIQGTFSVSWADAREPPSQLQEALKKSTKDDTEYNLQTWVPKTRVNKTKRRIPGVELRVHSHSTSIIIIINWRCAKNRQKGGTVCLYLHMETHPLRNNFTAGIRGSFLAFLGMSGSSPTTKIPTCHCSWKAPGKYDKKWPKKCISSASRTLEDLQPGRGQLSRWQQSGFNNERRGRTSWCSQPNLKNTVWKDACPNIFLGGNELTTSVWESHNALMQKLFPQNVSEATN
jgi:hypothetical protein